MLIEPVFSLFYDMIRKLHQKLPLSTSANSVNGNLLASSVILTPMMTPIAIPAFAPTVKFFGGRMDPDVVVAEASGCCSVVVFAILGKY